MQIKVSDFMVCKVRLLEVVQFYTFNEKYEIKERSLKNHILCKCFPNNTFYTLFQGKTKKLVKLSNSLSKIIFTYTTAFEKIIKSFISANMKPECKAK